MSNPLKKTNWKQWKRGLWFGLLSGLFQGFIAYGLVKKIEWQELVTLIVVNVGAAGFAWLQKHPVEEIEDTQIISKDETN